MMITLCLSGCQAESYSAISYDKDTMESGNKPPIENGEQTFNYVSSMELEYATGFSIDYYENGYIIVTIDDQKILLCPKENVIDSNFVDNYIVVRYPISNAYVAASSTPDLFDAIGCMEYIKFISTKYDDWELESVRARLNTGDITYVGKYSAPDYETLIAKDCNVAIESTMIYHKPEIKEELNALGIPVIVEKSSYESHPLGRLEWIKLYGVLCGKSEKAEEIYKEKVSKLDLKLSFDDKKNDEESTNKKKVAFFYISNNGSVVIRKKGDYISKMIEMAGGEYVPDIEEMDENALSTMNMQMEAFYKEAYDADILIYNSTIAGEIENCDQLIEKSELLKNFKAVKEKKVFCTEKNMFQQSSCIAEMIEDFNCIIDDNNEGELRYIYSLD